MDIEYAVEKVWAAFERNERPAAAIHQQLSIEQAYRVQQEVLRRFLATGQQLTGWKIGGNSDAARRHLGPAATCSGFLLARGAYASGCELELAGFSGDALLECELCMTLGKRLLGPGVTRESVTAAIDSIAPALELATIGRAASLDLGQLIADNAAQWGYVVGTARPYRRDLDLGSMQVTAHCNGEIVQQAEARQAVDNPLDSLAWLANHLAAYGFALEQGHQVMTGACVPAARVGRGEHWTAEFAGLGLVEATFK